MKLLVVGCPHSGTAFTAHVLSSAGIPCGHEAIYTLVGHNPAVTNVAEVSWAATFHLGTSTVPPGVRIVHQVRDPIAWLNSWVRSFLAHAADNVIGLAWPFLETSYPGIHAGHQKDPIGSALRLYVDMNLRCERHAHLRFRVEDLKADPGHKILKKLGRAAGVDLERKTRRAVLASASSQTNHHPGPPDYVPQSWDSLPRGSDFDQFARLARAYGY